jgi:hypothetical protein
MWTADILLLDIIWFHVEMKSCILNFQIALDHIIVAWDFIYQFIKPFRIRDVCVYGAGSCIHGIYFNDKYEISFVEDMVKGERRQRNKPRCQQRNSPQTKKNLQYKERHTMTNQSNHRESGAPLYEWSGFFFCWR